ncbi:MAG: hypothetical protein DRP37_03055, partial [Thermodesulfobacteriota bacterium]
MVTLILKRFPLIMIFVSDYTNRSRYYNARFTATLRTVRLQVRLCNTRKRKELSRKHEIPKTRKKYQQFDSIVSERKLTKTVISSKARNLIVLKIQALKISPYGRNDKKRG